MNPRDISIDSYAYPLPEDKIANYPLKKRDEAKLLYYADGMIESYLFKDLTHLLSADAVLVMNTTKVLRARLSFFRTTGARIEIFCLDPFAPALYEQSLATRHEVVWHCLVGQAKKWKEQYLEQSLGDGATLRVSRAGESSSTGVLIRFEWDNDMTFGELLEHLGELPIPPYLNRKTEESDLIDYQTVYAKEEGSVAAPTAGLHFTEELLEEMSRKGIQQVPVTLHVGAGTFLPVKSRTMADHPMHTEVIEVSLSSLSSLVESIRATRPIVSVGTTSARTLESLYYMGLQLREGAAKPFEVGQWLPYDTTTSMTTEEALTTLVEWLDARGEEKLFGQTRLMIAPGYQYRMIDYLITNFHQPKSTLLLLVAAFIGEEWQRMYDYALQKGYRFLSYGDGSLLKRGV